jgi:hypothetical protein
LPSASTGWSGGECGESARFGGTLVGPELLLHPMHNPSTRINRVTIRIVIPSPVSYGRELVADERRAEMITNAKKYGKKLY